MHSSDALSAHMILININTIVCIHTEHSPTNAVDIGQKYYM